MSCFGHGLKRGFAVIEAKGSFSSVAGVATFEASSRYKFFCAHQYSLEEIGVLPGADMLLYYVIKHFKCHIL